MDRNRVRELHSLCSDRTLLADALNKHHGIRDRFADLYPDQAHFIYELIQNAEDKNATQVRFSLEKHKLIFEHNGEPFTFEDVSSITDFGASSKARVNAKIGRFGVGFKSVFGYCEKPEIYSGTYSFRLENLVQPYPITDVKPPKAITRFVIPFDSPHKPAGSAHSEIREALEQINELSILFLSSITCIDCGFCVLRRNRYGVNHTEVEKESKSHGATKHHFLQFQKPILGLAKHVASIAYPLKLRAGSTCFDNAQSLAEQFEVSSEDPGIVAVFFPAEKEASGLRFHMHAPFIPELSRASIKETPENEPLFLQVEDLVAETLPQIRDLGLLTTSFLGVLPNQSDTLPRRYRRIRTRIINEMSLQCLVPKLSGGHAPSKKLAHGKSTLKSLVSASDMPVIWSAGDKLIDWVASPKQKGSRADILLSSLPLHRLDFEGLTQFILRNTRDSWFSEDFESWIKSKDDRWLQRFYAAQSLEADEGDLKVLSSAFIVRLTNGTYTRGCDSFFLPQDMKESLSLPCVSPKTYASGKASKEKQAAKNFLQSIGVREVSERDRVRAVLEQRYNRNPKPRRSDLKRFVDYIEHNPQDFGLFAQAYVLESIDGRWRRPIEIYLDEPFEKTGLRHYYSRFGTESDRFALSPKYLSSGVSQKRLVRFVKAIGGQVLLTPRKVGCRSNPEARKLFSAPGERITQEVDEDYAIPRLAKFLENPSLGLSKLVWNSLCGLPSEPDVLHARYQKNAKHGPIRAPSQLVYVLRTSKWVPQRNGNFVRPVDAHHERLPAGFPFDSEYSWVAAVQFGQADMHAKAERNQLEKLAEHFGLKLELLEFVRTNSESVEQLQATVAQRSRNRKHIGDSSPGNRERRRKKLQQSFEISPLKESRKAFRAVSAVARSEIDRIRLFDYYKCDSGSFYCQMCLDSMPFRRRASKGYCGKCLTIFSKQWADKEHQRLHCHYKLLERTWINDDSQRLRVMTPLNVVLCPTCFELYRDYVHNDIDCQNRLYEYFEAADYEPFEVCDRKIRCDGRETSVKWHRQHHDDIRICLGFAGR